MAIAVFPDDFVKLRHPISRELEELGRNGSPAWQWSLHAPDGEMLISVVGGCEPLLHGNGITTFEMWDFTEEEPRNWLTADEINQHLQDKQIEAPPKPTGDA